MYRKLLIVLLMATMAIEPAYSLDKKTLNVLKKEHNLSKITPHQDLNGLPDGYLISRKKLVGLMSEEGKIIMEPEYDDLYTYVINDTDVRVINYSKNGKRGLSHIDGTPIIQPEYSKITYSTARPGGFHEANTTMRMYGPATEFCFWCVSPDKTYMDIYTFDGEFVNQVDMPVCAFDNYLFTGVKESLPSVVSSYKNNPLTMLVGFRQDEPTIGLYTLDGKMLIEPENNIIRWYLAKDDESVIDAFIYGIANEMITVNPVGKMGVISPSGTQKVIPPLFNKVEYALKDNAYHWMVSPSIFNSPVEYSDSVDYSLYIEKGEGAELLKENNIYLADDFFSKNPPANTQDSLLAVLAHTLVVLQPLSDYNVEIAPLRKAYNNKEEFYEIFDYNFDAMDAGVRLSAESVQTILARLPSQTVADSDMYQGVSRLYNSLNSYPNIFNGYRNSHAAMTKYAKQCRIKKRIRQLDEFKQQLAEAQANMAKYSSPAPKRNNKAKGGKAAVSSSGSGSSSGNSDAAIDKKYQKQRLEQLMRQRADFVEKLANAERSIANDPHPSATAISAKQNWQRRINEIDNEINQIKNSY